MKEVIQFVTEEPRILNLLILSFILTFFGIAAGQLLPVIVSDFWHGGVEALGLTKGASGAGTPVSSFLITPLVLIVGVGALLLVCPGARSWQPKAPKEWWALGLKWYRLM